MLPRWAIASWWAGLGFADLDSGWPYCFTGQLDTALIGEPRIQIKHSTGLP